MWPTFTKHIIPIVIVLSSQRISENRDKVLSMFHRLLPTGIKETEMAHL